MKIFKSHFWYNKNQRNGIFFLVILIVLLQIVIFLNPFSSSKKIENNQKEILAFQQQIDSLKKLEIENQKPKIYPFNPNYITDFKGQKLGMSIEEIDRLLAFRKTNKFVNSKEEFQAVTKVSDSVLNKISPYFKFPDWVVKRNLKTQQNKLKRQQKAISNTTNLPLENKISTTDINKATLNDFQFVSGVDTKLAERIIKYRSKLQGFSYNKQLQEVWGLNKTLANKILNTFQVKEKPTIKKLNINTVEFKELLKNPYIDYNLCIKIFNYRDEVAELQNISELKKIEGFPLDKYDRIVLYLLAK